MALLRFLASIDRCAADDARGLGDLMAPGLGGSRFTSGNINYRRQSCPGVAFRHPTARPQRVAETGYDTGIGTLRLLRRWSAWHAYLPTTLRLCVPPSARRCGSSFPTCC